MASRLTRALVAVVITSGVALSTLAPAAQASPGSGGDRGATSTRVTGHEALSPRALRSPNYYATSFDTVDAGSAWFDVRALQYLLLSAGFKTNWETAYGSSTAQAVSGYQRKAQLPVTGVGDDATLTRLTPAVNRGNVTYRSYAIQTLLKKHGYWFGGAAPAMSTMYNSTTSSYVRSFQAGHGIGAADFVGTNTWPTLFAKKSSGALYPLLQKDTGRAEWSNCGPASAVSMMITMARVAPAKWGFNIANRSPAINDFRYRAMGVANTAARDKDGTEFPDFDKAFTSYGLTAWHGGINDTIKDARAGKPSIAGGDAHRLQWGTYVRGPVSHWVAVLGWNGTYFLVMDPISTTGSNVIHQMTETQLRYYAAINPGHPQSTAAKNSILVR